MGIIICFNACFMMEKRVDKSVGRDARGLGNNR